MYRRERLLKEMEDIDFCGKKVLEIGCGDGYYLCYFKQKHQDLCIHGVDISKEMLHLARKRAELDNADITVSFTDGKNLAFKSCIFDIVYIFAVLRHIDDSNIWEYAREISRVIKRNGKLIIFETLGEKKRGSMYIDRLLQDYVKIFQNHGFRLERFVCISSPFYKTCRKALNLSRIDKIGFVNRLLVYFIVLLTKRFDKVWQNESGNGFFVFTKD